MIGTRFGATDPVGCAECQTEMCATCTKWVETIPAAPEPPSFCLACPTLARLRDLEDDYRATLAEVCGAPADDRAHCSCVPHLRRRIRALEAELASLRAPGAP